jgi:hypothetical protein
MHLYQVWAKRAMDAYNFGGKGWAAARKGAVEQVAVVTPQSFVAL